MTLQFGFNSCCMYRAKILVFLFYYCYFILFIYYFFAFEQEGREGKLLVQNCTETERHFRKYQSTHDSDHGIILREKK